MKKISVLILTKNEEKNIKDCLASVTWADEIIIIDDYSEDKTIERCRTLDVRCKLFERHLNGDFAAQRNFALSQASGDWVLYIDADERVTPELEKSIKYKQSFSSNKVVSSKESNIVAYRIKRKNYYFGKHEWPHIESMMRLFKKEKLRSWQGELHESPIIEGEVGEIDGFLLHFTHQNLSSMLENTIEWSKTEAQLRLKANHPKITWWRFPRVMIREFLYYCIKQRGFKVGTVGLIESLYQSFSIFITYARLWEMQRQTENTTVLHSGVVKEEK